LILRLTIGFASRGQGEFFFADHTRERLVWSASHNSGRDDLIPRVEEIIDAREDMVLNNSLKRRWRFTEK
jgi:hypothetical protein